MANLPPSTSDGKASRGGTMLDHLQVTVTSTGEHLKLQKTDVRLKIIVTFRQIQIIFADFWSCFLRVSLNASYSSMDIGLYGIFFNI